MDESSAITQSTEDGGTGLLGGAIGGNAPGGSAEETRVLEYAGIIWGFYLRNSVVVGTVLFSEIEKGGSLIEEFASVEFR